MAQYDISLLYVEDDADTADSMEIILREYFQKVYLANDAKEAIEVFQKYHIDMVISDIELPIRSGLELVEELKNLDESLVVILFSAYDARDYLFKAIELSVCDYLVKPFHLEQFERVIEKCIKKLKKEKVNSLAYIDHLTGIYNRHKMLEVFESLQKQKTPFGFIMIDIDDFKQINDIYGHLKGDLILQQLSKCIKAKIRKEDFFGRWGGEEFVLFIPNIDRLRLFHKADALRKELEQCDFELEKNLTVSIGVGMYEGEIRLESLINRVDKALYKAKRDGKNRVESA